METKIDKFFNFLTKLLIGIIIALLIWKYVAPYEIGKYELYLETYEKNHGK